MNATPQNPYIGPRTFQRDEGHLFFGRDREARDLIALVASERLVVFYAQSGAGKSSIINTRLIPNLEEKEYEVLPVGRVGGEMATGNEVDNIYIYNLIRSLDQHDTDPDSLSKLSLTEFLAHLNYDDQGFFYDPNPVEPVLDEDISMIVRQALIIDQFEELFSTHPEAWEKREDFFQQLAQAMQDDPQLWVVLVMREDYIAALDPYAHLVPKGLRVRYYMQRLGHEAALDAVKGPVKGLRPYAEGVAEELIDDLCSIKAQKPDGTLADQPGQYVEPVQLQVVCYGLWDNLDWDNFDPEETQITDRDLQEIGDVNQSLGKYFDKRVAEVAQIKHVSERLIREWFEKKLITSDSFRNMVMQQREHKSGELDDDVIQVLQSDLVRAEKRGGATWYELTHDRLIEPILERNKIWFDENLSPLQRQAALWNEQGRNETWLFADQALTQAQDWAKEHQGELTEIEIKFLEKCQTKQEEKEKRLAFESQKQKLIAEQKLARQRRIIANISIVATIFTLILAVFGFIWAGKANAQSKISRAGELAALAQRSIDDNLQVSLLLGVESFKTAVTTQSRGSLLDATIANPQLLQFLTEPKAVTSVAFSPDGKTLASGSNDNAIILWDVETRQPIGQPLTGHTDAVTSVAFSPDGKIFASGSNDNSIILWNAGTHQIIDQLKGHTDAVTSVAFSPDGKILASGSYDNSIILWDVETRQIISQFMGHTDAVTSVAFSPGGKSLASGSYDNSIILWDVETRQLIGQPLTGHTDVVTSIAFSSNGKILASGSRDNSIILWDVDTYQIINQLKGHTAAVTSVAFSPDGKTLASGGNDNSIILWNAETLQMISQLKGHTGAVTSVAFNSDGKTLASGSNDNTTILWNVETGETISSLLTGHTDAVTSVAFSPDGKTLASGSYDNSIILWDVETHQMISQLTEHKSYVTSVAFSPDGKTLASGSRDNSIILWDVDTSQIIDQLKGHTDAVTSVVFSPDGKILASGSNDNSIILWDTETFKIISQLKGHTDAVTSVAFSPDGKILASSSVDKTIVLSDVATGQPIGQPLTGHTDAVTSVAFSPDGKALVSGSRDNTIIIWNTKTSQTIIQFTEHTAAVTSVAFSPDDKTLASGSNDNTTILWDTETNQIISQLKGHTGAVTSVAFNSDGKTLASGSYDKTTIMLELNPEYWEKKSCQRAGRNFTRAEWSRYFPDENYRKTCDQWPVTSTSIPIGTQVNSASATITTLVATTTPIVVTNTLSSVPTITVTTTPTVVTIPAPPSVVIPSDPVEFIYFYFENINNRNYDLTWSLLSDEFRNVNNPGGLTAYIDFWNQISNIVIYDSDYTKISDTSAVIIVHTNIASGPWNFYLARANTQSSWLFYPMPVSFNVSCSYAPKRLSMGIAAEVVTASDPLLLRDAPTDGIVIERMLPGLIVDVIDGPVCKYYQAGSVFLWWWKVRTPRGNSGWVVEGNDSQDPAFILPAGQIPVTGG